MTEPQDKTTGLPQNQAPLPLPEEEEENLSLLGEFIVFLKENKKWWLIPLIIIVAGLGILVVAGGSTALAPFIYSLF